MRIAFAYPFNDADWLGGKNYFSSLFAAVRQVASTEVDLLLFTGTRTRTTLPSQFPFLEVVRTPMMDRRTPAWTLRQLLRLPSRLAADPLLTRLLRRHRIDVFSHSSPLGRSAGIRTIGWLPDFQFLHHPDYWTPRQLSAMQRVYGDVCRLCDEVIVSSRAALADLERFSPGCTIPRHVLHFTPVPFDRMRLQPKPELLARHQLPDRYFHVPNQFWAHKNHGLLIEALAVLASRGVEATIACTGNPVDLRKPDHFDSLVAHARELGVHERFRVLGIVPYEDMQSLMAHSLAVINPSRFEGWSTSVEEAKAFGKPVLLSDLPVHREQAPSNAGYFGVDDAAALAALIEQRMLVPAPAVPAEALDAANRQAAAEFGSAYLRLIKRA